MCNTTEWVTPIVSAAAALFGALIGGGVVLLVARAERRERRENEHRQALSQYWAAVNGFAITMASLGSSSGNIVDRVVTNVEHRLHLGRLIDRMYAASDALWQAGGRLRAVATPDELAAVNEVEQVLGTWSVGELLPDAWTAAINRLRLCVESAGRQ